MHSLFDWNCYIFFFSFTATTSGRPHRWRLPSSSYTPSRRIISIVTRSPLATLLFYVVPGGGIVVEYAQLFGCLVHRAAIFSLYIIYESSACYDLCGAWIWSLAPSCPGNGSHPCLTDISWLLLLLWSSPWSWCGSRAEHIPLLALPVHLPSHCQGYCNVRVSTGVLFVWSATCGIALLIDQAAGGFLWPVVPTEHRSVWRYVGSPLETLQSLSGLLWWPHIQLCSWYSVSL